MIVQLFIGLMLGVSLWDPYWRCCQEHITMVADVLLYGLVGCRKRLQGS